MLNTRAICVAILGLLVWAASGAQKAAAPPRDPDVPYVPTTPEAVEAMLKLGQVKKTDLLYDLGCGDGRIVIAAAKNFGARGVGIDIDPQRIKEARENAKRAGVEDLVRFELGDLFEANFAEATVVTLFLLPRINLKLKPKLLEQLKPGTRVVSNTFDMGEWKAEKEASVDNEDFDTGLSRKFFLWTIPASKRAP
jgi:SAM-dependent methyltransferase